MLSVVIPVVIAVVLVLLFALRRSPGARQIAQSLSPADRQFIADELEPITTLPLNTAEDETAWHAATREMMRRLEERFPNVASVIPHGVYHYLDDADIHRKDPSYRALQERHVLEFIRELRTGPPGPR